MKTTEPAGIKDGSEDVLRDLLERFPALRTQEGKNKNKKTFGLFSVRGPVFDVLVLQRGGCHSNIAIKSNLLGHWFIQCKQD